MAGDLQHALRTVRDTLLAEPVSPRVAEPADINRHYCRYVAETVLDRVGDDRGVEILEDGGQGYVHTWLYHDGTHYDAECVTGVADYRDLPFFRRHPEAAVRVEPETTDPAALRSRGAGQLYTAMFARDRSSGFVGVVSAADWRLAAAGLLLGVVLLAVGLTGTWALHRHLLEGTPLLETVFLDATLLGEVLILVAPVVFVLLVPAHRASLER